MSRGALPVRQFPMDLESPARNMHTEDYSPERKAPTGNMVSALQSWASASSYWARRYLLNRCADREIDLHEVPTSR